MPQAPRISTKAREAAEDLAVLLQRIHDDGHVSQVEIVEAGYRMRYLLKLVAETDDAVALSTAMLRGGPAAPRVHELARQYADTHGVVVPFADTKRRRSHGHGNDAA